MTDQRWGTRRVSEGLFVALFGKASLLIYRANGAPVEVKLGEVRPLIRALTAAAGDLASDVPRIPFEPPQIT
jgi:hypothetical protein